MELQAAQKIRKGLRIRVTNFSFKMSYKDRNVRELEKCQRGEASARGTGRKIRTAAPHAMILSYR